MKRIITVMIQILGLVMHAESDTLMTRHISYATHSFNS